MADSSPPVLVIDDTRYAGAWSDDRQVAAYLGVPFAAPPVEELRWQPPMPAVTPAGLVDASEYAPACYQGQHLVNWYRNVITSFGGDPDVMLAPEFSEDCLYLNIWAPKQVGKEPLPVMVYVHGGSNKGGWSYEVNYVGEKLAKQGVVLISIPYRLGVFGFFSHPHLSQSNFALLDLVAALNWIKRHAAAFGGDPDNVTLFGESAGASNISALLVSPLAQGLFQRVILQSSGWALQELPSRQDRIAMGRELQEIVLGAEGDLTALRAAPADHLLEAATSIYADIGFDPVIDGVSLAGNVLEAVSREDWQAVDLLVGSNKDEWLMYLDQGQKLDEWLEVNLPGLNAQELLAAMGPVKSELEAIDRLVTAQKFVCPSMLQAATMSQNNARTWFYLFARQRAGEMAASMGAYHGAELPYVFDTHDPWLPTNADDRQVTRQLMNAWVHFARHGSPGNVEGERWPEFRLADSMTMIFDTVPQLAVHRDRNLCNLLSAPTR